MQLIFVSGINRSGTHLLISLLSGHSMLCALDNEDEMVSGMASGRADFERALSAGSIGKLYRALLTHTFLASLKIICLRGYTEYSKNPDEFSSRIGVDFNINTFERDLLIGLSDKNFGALSVRSFSGVLEVFYRTLAKNFGEADKPYIAAKPATGAQGFLDIAEELKELRPKILYILRDPRAVACSSLKGESDPLPYAQLWLTDYLAMQKLAKILDVHVVKYEDLCSQPKAEMNRICIYLGIPFEEILIKPTMRRETFSGNSSFESFGGDISSLSVDRWRSILNPGQVKIIENAIGKALVEAGYIPTRRLGVKGRIKGAIRGLGTG